MDRYDPPYTITDGMLERVASISEKLGRISTARGLENKPQQRPNLNRAASAAPRNNPAPAPQKKKIMGEFNFNEMMKEINSCQRSADMKNIVLKWAGAFELSDEQRASANDARQRRYGYLKKINR